MWRTAARVIVVSSTLHNPPDFEEDQVVDLLSKETLFSRVCNTPGRIPCDVDDSMEINAEKAFAKALVTQGELPLQLQMSVRPQR
jgi:hypothetical protein